MHQRALKENILNEIVLRVEIDQHFESSIQSEVCKYIKKENVPLNPHDIFNNANSKDAKKCVCPNCGRTLNALRFVPHLEKCLGMGRSNSRAASRRILASSNSGKEGKYSDENSDGNGGGSQSSDADWEPSKAPKRARVRRRNDCLAPHHENRKKVKDTVSSGGGVDFIYSNMDVEQRQNILALMCGVVSKHTGKLCTRSIKCPKHTDEQKNNVRLTLLNI